MFSMLSDRLTATFKSLRGKGRLSPSDVDATVREIRRALLDADVALPVVREFTATVGVPPGRYARRQEPPRLHRPASPSPT